MNDSPCRKPAGPYLIESAPKLKKHLAAKADSEIAQRIMSPLTIFSAAVSGYRSELRRMTDAAAIYIGPGK